MTNTAKKIPDAAADYRIVRFLKGTNDADGSYVLIESNRPTGKRRATVRYDTPIDYRALNQMGFPFVSRANRSLFEKAIDDHPDRKVRVIPTRPGWFGNRFVQPGQIAAGIGSAAIANYWTKFRCVGSLQEWKKIPEAAIGNSRLMFALSLAFVGPLGRLLQCEQPAFQLVGPQSSHKSDILNAAGSVWGANPDRIPINFIETWSATTNGFEEMAIAHNQTFLALDETGLMKAKPDFDAVIMMFERGTEKRRWASASAASWWIAILSTSNAPVSDLVYTRDDAKKRALMTRLIDIPNPKNNPSSAFEQIGGYRNIEEMAGAIRHVVGNNYGVAANRFLTRLHCEIKNSGIPALKRRLKKAHKRYKKLATKLPFDGSWKIDRIHEKYATVYAAGWLAINFKILPWRKKALRAALLTCERATLEHLSECEFTHRGDLYKNYIRKISDAINAHPELVKDVTEELLSKNNCEEVVKSFFFRCVWNKKQEILIPIPLWNKIFDRKEASLAKTVLAPLMPLGDAARGGSRYTVLRRVIKGKGTDGRRRRHRFISVYAAAVNETF